MEYALMDPSTPITEAPTAYPPAVSVEAVGPEVRDMVTAASRRVVVTLVACTAVLAALLALVAWVAWKAW